MVFPLVFPIPLRSLKRHFFTTPRANSARTSAQARPPFSRPKASVYGGFNGKINELNGRCFLIFHIYIYIYVCMCIYIHNLNYIIYKLYIYVMCFMLLLYCYFSYLYLIMIKIWGCPGFHMMLHQQTWVSHTYYCNAFNSLNNEHMAMLHDGSTDCRF